MSKRRSKTKKHAQDHLERHCERVRAYLCGESDNPMICTNHKIAGELEKMFEIHMYQREPVNKKVGLYMFEIIDILD